MPNYSNLLIQSLVEANERKTREEQELEEELRNQENEQEAIDAEEQEQDALEQEAQDVENMEDPTDYDVDPDGDAFGGLEPDENELSDEELAELEAEDDQEVSPDEVTPYGDPEAQAQEETIPPEEETVPDDQVADDQQVPVDDETDDSGQIPEEVPIQDQDAVSEDDVPVEDSEEVPDFNYDDQGEQPPAEEEGAPAEDQAAEQPADPNAAGMDQAPPPPDPSTQNIQVNILNLSKLDKALAKKHMYGLFMDLRSSINTTLNIIDRNETVIEPVIRDDAIESLNRLLSGLNTYISVKFQLVNYEGAFQAYNIFTEQFNALIDYVKTGDIEDKSNKHKNKGDSSSSR